MNTKWSFFQAFCKPLCAAALIFISGCSTNPATGENQFTALMSPAQERQIGAQEHEKVLKTYGIPDNSTALQAYVSQIGNKVAQNTERTDVQYKFTLLDSPMVNAFAIPGGYIYVTRGLMAFANSEAELAGVIAHEIAHITGRHSAERYSHGVLTSLGAIAVSAALDSSAATQALGIGSELYITSYSRKQESQADDLGIRYLHKADYDTFAMASFLNSLDRESNLKSSEKGQGSSGTNYFATHPKTENRVQQALNVAGAYPLNQKIIKQDEYLGLLDGMVYGDSEKQGFVRGQTFWHPQMDFTFTVPSDFTLSNQPTQVVASSKKTGSVAILDSVLNREGLDALSYMQKWVQGKPATNMERIEINGKAAATASLSGTVQGNPVEIRLVAIQWRPDIFFRFQMAIPQAASASLVDDLKRMTYSLRSMTSQEKQSIRALSLKIVKAGAGETVASLSQRMAVEKNKEEHFRVLNGLSASASLVAGKSYKIVVE